MHGRRDDAALWKERDQSCQQLLANCGCQNEATQGLISQSCGQDYSILDIQCAAPTDFPSRYACSALPQILSAGKKPQHIVSDRQRSLSGLCCCPDKEESICFSSKTSLCLVYQTLTASAMTATPVTLLAVDPEQLSSPEPNDFPDQAALCAEGGRGHTKNTVCVHVTREQRNVSWAQGRDIPYAWYLITEWSTLQL